MTWYEAAIINYMRALEFEPDNEALKKGLADAKSDSKKREEKHRKTNSEAQERNEDQNLTDE